MYGFEMVFFYGIWILVGGIILYSILKTARDSKKIKKMEDEIRNSEIKFFSGSNVKEFNKKTLENFGRIEGYASFTFGLPNIENSRIHIEAKYNLLKRAEEIGANAIVNYHIQNTFFNGPYRQVMASGNAVILQDINKG